MKAFARSKLKQVRFGIQQKGSRCIDVPRRGSGWYEERLRLPSLWLRAESCGLGRPKCARAGIAATRTKTGIASDIVTSARHHRNGKDARPALARLFVPQGVNEHKL